MHRETGWEPGGDPWRLYFCLYVALRPARTRVIYGRSKDQKTFRSEKRPTHENSDNILGHNFSSDLILIVLFLR
jgi:hypothetical protein